MLLTLWFQSWVRESRAGCSAWEQDSCFLVRCAQVWDKGKRSSLPGKGSQLEGPDRIGGGRMDPLIPPKLPGPHSPACLRHRSVLPLKSSLRLEPGTPLSPSCSVLCRGGEWAP